VLAAVVVATTEGCASRMERTEGADMSVVPPEQQADYAVFAERCSKCHALARPLNSGITDDAAWSMYVEKMRRQPSSGISVADTVPILRFLHWYSLAQKAKQKGDGG
jgi:hypothetical protein